MIEFKKLNKIEYHVDQVLSMIKKCCKEMNCCSNYSIDNLYFDGETYVRKESGTCNKYEVARKLLEFAKMDVEQMMLHHFGDKSLGVVYVKNSKHGKEESVDTNKDVSRTKRKSKKSSR